MSRLGLLIARFVKAARVSTLVHREIQKLTISFVTVAPIYVSIHLYLQLQIPPVPN